MKWHLTSHPKTYSLYIVLTLVCLGLISVGVASRSRRHQDLEPRIINKTKALKVKSAQKSAKYSTPTLEITLTNESSKSIMTYTLLIGDTVVATDYAFSEKLLVPGGTEVIDIPMAGLESTAAKNHSVTLDVVISALYFDDQTGEGDSKYLSMIQDKYLGIKEQALCVLSILRKAVDPPLDNTERRLSEIKAQAALLKIEDENTKLSFDYRSGLRLVKQNLEKNVQIFESQRGAANVSEFKAEIQKLIATYDQLLARL